MGERKKALNNTEEFEDNSGSIYNQFIDAAKRYYSQSQNIYNFIRKDAPSIYQIWMNNPSERKDISYSLLAGPQSATSLMRNDANGRIYANLDEIIQSLRDYKSISQTRGKIPRNLTSLYVYGNDLHQFEESPELRDVGVEYDNYLVSHGIDPEQIKTYKGDIPYTLSFPDFIDSDKIKAFIESDKNKTFGRQQELDRKSDDVSGYLTRLSIINGVPKVVNSDLWKFEPISYEQNYKDAKVKRATVEYQDDEKGAYVPGLRHQAYVASKLGTPFILKDVLDIQYMDPDNYYNLYNGRSSQNKEIEKYIMDNMGILPELIVRPKK